MPDTIALGPLSLRTLASAVVIGALVAVVLARTLATRAGLHARDTAMVLVWALLAALLAGRVAHVVANLPAYSERPWTALYLWQPGYVTLYCIAAGVSVGLLLLGRRPPAQRDRELFAVCAASVAGFTAAAATLALLVTLAPPVAGRGARLPDFELQDLDGATVRWASNDGYPVILNFWATWCAPCRREMPRLDQVARGHAKRGLRVIGVAVGEDARMVRRFFARTPVVYPLWVDGGDDTAESRTRALFDRLGGVGLPTTFFVGADGRIAHRMSGELSAALLNEWAERLTRR